MLEEEKLGKLKKNRKNYNLEKKSQIKKIFRKL